MERGMKDVVGFFRSVDIGHRLEHGSDGLFLKVSINYLKNGIVLIRVIEKVQKENDNIVCDVRIEGNKVSMIFKLNYLAQKMSDKIKPLIKNNFTVSYLGNSLKIVIRNPEFEDVANTFVELEQYCLKRKEEKK